MKTEDKPIILILIGYYLPGYKAGGPLRTIKHLVEHLSKDFNFKIICRDRDLGDTIGYKGIMLDQWVKKGDSEIFYISPKNLTFKNLNSLIDNTSHDILYLNSFFDPVFTLIPLIGRKFKMFANKKVILAPRGEFSPEALKLKTNKKRVWLLWARILGVYKDVTFQASSSYEEIDIRKISSFKKSNIKIALDLPSKTTQQLCGSINQKKHSSGKEVKLIFLSRISPMKNLDYALSILRKVTRPLIFDIYGPIEDLQYWNDCQKIILDLPTNINVNYRGSLSPHSVPTTFQKYDLFFFPSRGENYGHVIAESLSAGTPVLISDRTPWKKMESEGLGWDYDLKNSNNFIKRIDRFEPEIYDNKRNDIQKRLFERLEKSGDIQANKNLFSFK